MIGFQKDRVAGFERTFFSLKMDQLVMVGIFDDEDLVRSFEDFILNLSLQLSLLGIRDLYVFRTDK